LSSSRILLFSEPKMLFRLTHRVKFTNIRAMGFEAVMETAMHLNFTVGVTVGKTGGKRK
jgi:hypothetical protein